MIEYTHTRTRTYSYEPSQGGMLVKQPYFEMTFEEVGLGIQRNLPSHPYRAKHTHIHARTHAHACTHTYTHACVLGPPVEDSKRGIMVKQVGEQVHM